MRRQVIVLVFVAIVARFPYVNAGDSPDAKKPDGSLDALRMMANAKNYEFDVEFQNSKVEGKYKSAMPLLLRADGIDFFCDGDRLVYLKDGKWQRTRTGTLSDPLQILAASAKAQRVPLPHLTLPVLARSLKNLKTQMEHGETILSGEVNNAAASDLAQPEDRDLARGSKAQVWFKGTQIFKYRIEIFLKGRRGNADVDGIATSIGSSRNLGMTTVDIPAQARTALE